MSTGLLFDSDEAVANWLFQGHVEHSFKYDRAIGLLNDGALVGAVMFHCFNGYNVELSYYGKSTLTLGVVKCLALFAMKCFNPARCTVVTSKRNKHLMRSLQKLGFKLEGTQRCYYGQADSIRNTGVRFVLFREQIERLVGLSKEVAQC